MFLDGKTSNQTPRNFEFHLFVIVFVPYFVLNTNSIIGLQFLVYNIDLYANRKEVLIKLRTVTPK